MAKIYAPNKSYTGETAGVGFVNGVGECADPYLLKWFKEKGYTVEQDKSIEEAEAAQDKDTEEKKAEDIVADVKTEKEAENKNKKK